MTAARQVEDVEAAVEARMRRQEILTRPDPPQIWVLLDESILRRPVGDPTIMRGQLARMLEAADMPHVTIRIIRESVGYYVGLDSSFNLLTTNVGDIVFIEAGGGRLIQDPAEVKGHVLRWDRIGACAQPWDTSRDLMAQVMKEVE